MPNENHRKKIKLKLRCNLTSQERLAIGQSMADTLNEIGSLENDAKSMASDFKARIDSRKATLNSDKNKLQAGYEYRDVDCQLLYDDPKPGYKRVVREDTGENVEVTTMSDEDKQQVLALDAEKAE